MARQPFAWSPTTSMIRVNQDLISLTPSVTPNMGPVNLKIDTERELQFSNSLGWNWHKSWNIPNISVKMNLHQEQCTQFVDCQVQLMAVKLVSEVYEEVGLEGVTLQDVVDGKAFFSGVRFNSTTYNHQGNKFHLLLVVKNCQKIILALQSPPVFVDSRKSARDEHRLIQYLQPFEIRSLEKNFFKKSIHDTIDAPIENNENGLYNYLTAPNIRNKIKHPLFLGLKFSKCFTIHYEKDFEEANLIEFQRQLMSKGDSQFIMAFQSSNNRIRRKIEESLTNLFIQSQVKVFERKNIDDSKYKQLTYNAEDYQQVYEQLLETMNQDPIQVQRKSAFRKFSKELPTKNFNEEDQLKKQVKIEADNQQYYFQLLQFYIQQQIMLNLLSQ